jgi:hypothetical protein
MSEAVTGTLLVGLSGVGDTVSIPRGVGVVGDEGNVGEAVVGVAVIRIAVVGEAVVGVAVIRIAVVGEVVEVGESFVVTVGVIVGVTVAVAVPVGVGLEVVVGKTVRVKLLVVVGVKVGVSVFCRAVSIFQREDKTTRNAPVVINNPGIL